MSTRKFMNSIAAIVSVSVGLASIPAFAQQAAPADPTKVENVSKTAKRPDGLLPVRQLELANSLAKFGRDNKDPLSLIVAARMLQQVSFKQEDRKPDNADASANAKGDALPTVDGLLKDAKDISANDKTIVALADDVKAAATKGRVGGGLVSLGQITGSTVHTRTINFAGGRFAEVAATGIDTSDMVLEVFDQGGHLICRDSDPAYCSFNPIWTGPFTVKVHNTGGDVSHYKLETN